MVLEGAGLVTRLLRVWRAVRSIGENPVPHMQARIAPSLPSPELAPACDSLFMLTEAVLGRPLVTGRCGSIGLSRDETAVLLMLRHWRAAGSVRTSAAVPHGLPEALRWAAFAVTRALDERFDLGDIGAAGAAGRCPFGGAGLERAA